MFKHYFRSAAAYHAEVEAEISDAADATTGVAIIVALHQGSFLLKAMKGGN